MLGLGLRREMADWDWSVLRVDFIEATPENWLHRDRSPLHAHRAAGRAVLLHGVALNLGGAAPLRRDFVRAIGALLDELGTPHYSDHLAATGDAHVLHDLFPVPFTAPEARRVADRIRCVQDWLGRRIAVENITWYSRVGDLPEPVFVQQVLEAADCDLLLDLNNLAVNHRNHGQRHGQPAPQAFVQTIDPARVRYLHVAGHEFDPRFGLAIDTHSRPVEPATAALARRLHAQHGWPVLLEWDHDLPGPDGVARELACLRTSTTM